MAEFPPTHWVLANGIPFKESIGDGFCWGSFQLIPCRPTPFPTSNGTSFVVFLLFQNSGPGGHGRSLVERLDSKMIENKTRNSRQEPLPPAPPLRKKEDSSKKGGCFCPPQKRDSSTRE